MRWRIRGQLSAGPGQFDEIFGRSGGQLTTSWPRGAELFRNAAAVRRLAGFVDRWTILIGLLTKGSTEMLKFQRRDGPGVFGKLVNKIPGVETQPLLIDRVTGQPVPIVPGTGPNGLNPLMQAVRSPASTGADAVWDAIYEINGSYTQKELSKDLLPTRWSSSGSTKRCHG